ncbi:MAG: EAL domain-containing protein [Clostridiales bacterium]|jgi:EAL domain-containing protein (putative c-di-GMP-specific phosphodiesterase class I)|nr:EAL domain-containing protein [Clostridiales bacterium]
MLNELRNVISNKDIDLVFHLEKAIDNNEFEIYYQPIIHTISGSLCGFEALVRWHHPSLGFLTPGQFLTPLEETRQLYHLDIYVIERVCQWYAEQVKDGKPVVPVSVNLSRIDFESTDIFRIIEALTAKYHMPHSMLNIEITESAISENAQHMHATIERFRNAGYQVWMDDFGSGYSSLNTLKEFEFDQIKIDMVFLSDMSERSKQIIRAMISMAKDISMITLVEGVETREQVEFLKSIGCDRMQGFYFSKPLPYNMLVPLLTEKGITFETDEDRQYYHRINRINLLSPSPFSFVDKDIRHMDKGIPLAMLEYRERDDEYVLIYQDDEFRQLMSTLGASDATDAIQKLIHFGILTREEIDDFFAQTISSGEHEINFKTNGDLCSARAMLVSSKQGHKAMLLSINNITQRMNINHEQLIDQSLMNIYKMYLRVSIMRPEKNELITVFSQDHHDISVDVVHKMDTLLEDYANTSVQESDRRKYMNFLDPATLEQRILESGRGFINIKIKTLDEDGGYSNKMYLAVSTGNHEVVLLVRYANL